MINSIPSGVMREGNMHRKRNKGEKERKEEELGQYLKKAMIKEKGNQL